MSPEIERQTPFDPGALREQVRFTCRRVATEPGGEFHFHTGRSLARRP